MNDIFISYSREDLNKVEPIISLFEQRNWSVFWDRKIPPGKSFDEVIEKALEDAKCIIVIWSKNSVQSRWVRNEAIEGLNREIVVPVLIDDDIQLPFQFRNVQSVHLMDWDGKLGHPGINILLGAVESLVPNNWETPSD
ncbi:MAG TPA: toll/interleukin-1 receptor domain-containing protein, partial [Pyrinomonadaceae bacterium]